jgi:hypothetical protein
MEITRSSTEGATANGPAEWFTGDVYIDSVATRAAPSRVQASLVHFVLGARTAWHRTRAGQTLLVTEGIGLPQRRGGPVEIIRPAVQRQQTLARRRRPALKGNFVSMIVIDKNIMVPMTDGVRLATDVFRQQEAPPAPVPTG